MSSSGKTLYKILEKAPALTKAGKNYIKVILVDQQGVKVSTNIFDSTPTTPFIYAILEKKDKYWNCKGAEETSDSFTEIKTSTTATPIAAPPSADEALEKDYYEQILKSGKLSEDALEYAMTANIDMGMTSLVALKAIAKSNQIELKQPETKEEKIDRMARERDELVKSQMAVMKEMTTEMKELRASINQLKETLFQFVGAIQVPQKEAKK